MLPEEGCDRSIQLEDVSRDIVDDKKGNRTALRRVTAAIASCGNIAIMGPDPDLLTAFLHLVAGSDAPDHGRVVTAGMDMSPVVNAGGLASCLVPQLTAIDNINFFATVHDIKASALSRVVELACRFGPLLHAPIRTLDGPKRRAIEVALIAALPFDCYLIDRVDLLLPELRWLMARAASARGASMIYATQDIRIAKQFGGVGFVVENGKLRAHAELTKGFQSARDLRETRGVAIDG